MKKAKSEKQNSKLENDAYHLQGTLLKHLLEGMGSVLVMFPDDSYQKPSRNGFAHDMKRLKKDSNAVSRIIRLKTSTYGK
ncbi:MAG: hypothetical protein HZA04_06075 [Nitrospinae bacterium]|nr:hypothetical protein [Nitrospinota bacterium]